MRPGLIKAKPGFFEWCRSQEGDKGRGSRSEDHEKQIDFYRVRHFLGGPTGFYLTNNVTNVAIDTRDTEMYLPVHHSCFQVAKSFCRYQSRFDMNFRDVYNQQGAHGGTPTGIAHFYEIWMKRALLMEPGNLGPLQHPIDEPNRYLGVTFVNDLRLYGIYLQRNSPEFRDPRSHPRLTTINIIKLAKRMNIRQISHQHRDIGTFFACRMLARAIKDKLPPEIRNRIYEEMEPFEDLQLDEMMCTRVLPPRWWRDRLFNGDLIPWLFDLDIDMAREMNGHGEDWDDGLDWEYLCRQLAHPSVNSRLLSGMDYLKNRRRIWTILGKATLGTIGCRRQNSTS